jgi:hypothetical protein
MTATNESLTDTASKIVDLYHAVASGASKGSRGSFYANGKGTLCSVHLPVELCEELAKALGREVMPRDSDFRKAETGSN